MAEPVGPQEGAADGGYAPLDAPATGGATSDTPFGAYPTEGWASPGYVPYGPSAWGPYAYGAWAPPKNNGLAIASIVLGGCSFALCPIFAIPGVVVGLLARRQIRESNGAQTGDTLALAGIIMSAVGLAYLVLMVLYFAFIFGFVFTTAA